MLDMAIEKALSTVKRNIPRFTEKFPIVSERGQGKYELEDNDQWTSGFWPGLLWLCYEYSGESIYRTAAERAGRLLEQRMKIGRGLEHHDLGFLYTLSATAQWRLTNDEAAKQLTFAAADALMKRWRPASQLIQAWGIEGDAENGGRIIIDCLMNLPLLFLASSHTGDPSYKDCALKQLEKSRRYLVRGDDSSYHTFYFNQKDGTPIRGGTHQGYHDGSTWTRGQAWGIYGFALAYRYTADADYLETAKRLAHYFIKHLPEDYVVYWDFSAADSETTFRDSSASAIASAGLLELVSLLDEQDNDKDYFSGYAEKIMSSLIKNYTPASKAIEGLLMHGSYHVRAGISPDDCMIWGDYFFLEALLRLKKGIRGYWYE